MIKQLGYLGLTLLFNIENLLNFNSVTIKYMEMNIAEIMNKPTTF